MTIDELMGVSELIYKTKIDLKTPNDVMKFVGKLSQYVDDNSIVIKLTDKANWMINAKSLLGCMTTIEWDEVYVYSNKDIYEQIMEFAA